MTRLEAHFFQRNGAEKRQKNNPRRKQHLEAV